MTSGEYTLRLVCDAKECSRALQAGDHFAMIVVEPTKMEALATARKAGWMIRHSGRTLCADDAEKLRAGHWRVKA